MSVASAILIFSSLKLVKIYGNCGMSSQFVTWEICHKHFLFP